MGRRLDFLSFYLLWRSADNKVSVTDLLDEIAFL